MTPQITDTLAWTTLINLTVTTLLHMATLTVLPMFIWKNYSHLSVHVILNLIMVVAAVIGSLPWNLMVFFGWNGTASNYNRLLSFSLATPSFGLYLVVSFSVTFLTIDRILTISTIKYTVALRQKLSHINVVTLIVVYLAFIVFMCYNGIPSKYDYAGCLTYVCNSPHAIHFLLAKSVVGLVNTILGIAFCSYLFYYNKNKLGSRKHYTMNMVGIYIVIIEFFFNSVPQSTVYFTYGTKDYPFGNFGPITVYLFGYEAFILTLINIKIVGNPFKSKHTNAFTSYSLASTPKITPVKRKIRTF